MISFENLLVTDIEKPIMVFSEHGKTAHMTNRRSFGLSFCLSGQITYELDGKRYVSDPKHAVILPKGRSYTLYRDKTGLFPLINFQCSHFPCDTFLLFPLPNPQACIKEYEMLQKLYLFPENRLRIYSIFYGLLHQITKQTSPEQSILAPAADYLRRNLSDPNLSNTILAEQAGISEVYFRKLFAEQYHTTPKQYILDIRIRNAMQLLTDTGSTVTSISERCGFSSVYHFCRVFRQRTGMTPKQYAAKNRIYKL